MATPAALLLAATFLHLGFQATVSVVVYPALARAETWDRAHPAHTRSITPLVAVVYLALVGSCASVLVSGVRDAASVVALCGVAVSVGTTALVAGPLHGRLAEGRDEALLRRLLVADRVRAAGAVVAAAAALLAAL